MTFTETEPDAEGGVGLGDAWTRESPRQRFLRYSGFVRDPFAQPTAEQEYGFADRDTFHLPPHPTPDAPARPPGDEAHLLFSPLNYYVDPRYADRRDGSVFDELRAEGHTLVYGRPGDGKSTLRLAVEAHLRGRPDRTLAVTYEPGRVVETEVAEAVAAAPRGATASQAGASRAAARRAARDAHLRALSRALAVDLFIQIIEQFGYRRQKPTAAQNRRLCYLLLFVEPRLQGVMEQLMFGEEPSDVWGFARLWRTLDRPIVRPVIRTPPMIAWFQALRAQRHEQQPKALSASALWRRVLDTARLWGFERVYVLLDGLDTWWRSESDMLDLLDPLLRLLPAWGRRVSLKCFLPLPLRDEVAARLARYGVDAAALPVIVLAWTPERLRALLLERFRAAGARRLWLGDLVEEALRDEIDDQLIVVAAGSPRRLLLLVHELIEAHVGRLPVERPMTRAEWATAQEMAERRMAVDA